MKPTALVYLRDNEAAQRLVVAWPLVPAEQRASATQAGLVAWSNLSDVPLETARRLALVLLAHGIVLEDGTVARDAENFIAAQVAASMPRRKP